MGVLDTAKMLRKAQQTKSAMSKIQVAGSSKSGQTALLLNGLNEIIEIEFGEELVMSQDGARMAKEVMEAFKDARKQLEREMAANMDLDSIRDMFN